MSHSVLRRAVVRQLHSHSQQGGERQQGAGLSPLYPSRLRLHRGLALRRVVREAHGRSPGSEVRFDVHDGSFT